MTKRHTWGRRIAIGFALILGTVAALVIALVIAAHTDAGRQQIARTILNRINENLPGSLTLDSLDELSLSSLRGQGLRILAPGGRETLRADAFTIDYSLSKALSGELLITSAEVVGGRVVLEELPSGRIRLEDAVARASPVRTPSAPLEFRRIQFRGLELVIQPAGAPVFRMRGLRGAIAIRKLPMSAVRLDVMGVDGTLRTPAWSGDIGIRGVRGRVDADARRMLELRGKSQIASDDPNDWRLAYGPRPEPWVRFGFEPTGIATEVLSAQLRLFATFSPLLSMEEIAARD